MAQPPLLYRERNLLFLRPPIHSHLHRPAPTVFSFPNRRAINKQTKRPRLSYRLWIALLRSRSGRRTKIRCVYIEVVCLWIVPHRLGSELGLHSFDDADFVRRVFMKDMDRTLARGGRILACFGVIEIGVHTIPDRKWLSDDLACVRIHHDENFWTAPSDKEPPVLAVHCYGDGLPCGRD